MKIACLQFAPQVGDVDNNLNRADAVLNKANQSELEDLDLLVLPELAFSGYNFKSLQDISPFLEPTGSGISALWARTTALKFNCNVALGYPEKVDVTPEWPASPEYYNSCLIVNGDGETIANYRKSFLYYIDEKWALEGRDGFYDDYIPGLGSTAMGICSDLKFVAISSRPPSRTLRERNLTRSSPYKLEAPWLAFEFAFHVLHVAADLVILSMAWPTDEDQRMYSRMPQEPDMDTITYWVQRLEPLIRAEQDDEIIVVFCNRTGTEEDLTYAGTSAVVGIKSGEVSVYGLLGRGVKEVLVVDTDLPAFAKLVQRTDPYPQVEPTSNPSLLLPSRPPAPPPPESLPEVRKGHTPKLSAAAVERQRSKPATASTTATSLPSQSSRNESPKPQSVKEPAKKLPIPQKSEKPPHISTEKRTEMPPAVDTTNIQSPTGTGRRKEKPMSPTIIIPDSAFRSKPPATDSSRDDSPMVETPTAPSPTPAHMRPKLYLPQTEEEFNKNYRQALTPFPGTGPDPRSEEKLRAKPYIYDGSVTVTTDLLTPRTPYLEFFRDSSPQESKFYWVPSQQMMETPVETRLPQNATSGNSRLKSSMAASSTGHMPRRPFRSPGSGTQTPQEISEKPAKVRVPTPAEVQPPETVLGSRAGARSRGPPTDPQTSAAAPTEASVASPERLRHVGKRSGSRAENISSPVVERGRAHFDFSSSPFTHSSRGRDTNPRSPILDRQKSTSRASIPIAASPSLFSGGFRPEEQGEQQLNDEKQMSQIKGPDPEPLPRSVQRGQDSPKGAARDANRPSSSRQDRRDRTAAKERNISRPTSRRGHHDPVEERDFQSKLRSRSLGGGEFAVRRVRAADIAAKNSPMYGGNIARPQTSIGHRRDEPPKLSPTYNPKLSPTALSDPSDRTTLQSQRGRPVIDRGSSYGPERRAGSKTSRMSPENPFTGEGDDEIIATISRINDGCPVHTTNGGPPAAVVKSEDGTLYAVEFAKGAESLAESIIPTHQKNVLTRFGIEGLSRRQSAVW
ncbi:uncharacterized protein PgNI_07449 [Pyricularia grisea]|uniref:CN hydrolase domain-containing protein n=1 Tax=Pyricularia grisea TaxID=148305 RepID=A0A6P8B1Z8_PYRGI|nr:uncharacterized protein PgNI_07449 [Pyricularia grisea]TLD08743.1 hypothetical protein PgNI_07449 [Pyricularia grisea]